MALRHSYERGDVVLVHFPFSDILSKKHRPALVVSTQAYHDDWDEILLVALTFRPPRHTRPTDYELIDWRLAGLAQPSWTRAHLATLHWKLVNTRVGRLTSRDLQDVDVTLRVATGL